MAFGVWKCWQSQRSGWPHQSHLLAIWDDSTVLWQMHWVTRPMQSLAPKGWKVLVSRRAQAQHRQSVQNTCRQSLPLRMRWRCWKPEASSTQGLYTLTVCGDDGQGQHHAKLQQVLRPRAASHCQGPPSHCKCSDLSSCVRGGGGRQQQQQRVDEAGYRTTLMPC